MVLQSGFWMKYRPRCSRLDTPPSWLPAGHSQHIPHVSSSVRLSSIPVESPPQGTSLVDKFRAESTNNPFSSLHAFTKQWQLWVAHRGDSDCGNAKLCPSAVQPCCIFHAWIIPPFPQHSRHIGHNTQGPQRLEKLIWTRILGMDTWKWNVKISFLYTKIGLKCSDWKRKAKESIILFRV